MQLNPELDYSSGNPDPVAFFGLPKEVKFCRKCVISNQRPSSTVEFKSSIGDKKETIGFGADGLCEACRYQDIKATEIDWEERNRDLLGLLDKYRRNDGRYDVIVPGSGGKDSSYTAHVLKYKYGMNPLTVTWAPHKYTEIGWRNFENWLHTGGFDNILFTPNGKVHRFLTREAFLNLLHPFQPFIVGQKIIGPVMALKYGVELVMYGENQAEYGNNIDDNADSGMDKSFFSLASEKEIRLGGLSIPEILEKTNFTKADMAPYIAPPYETIQKQRINVQYLGYFLKWDPQECFYYAVEHCGFEANDRRTEGSYSKYSSIDDQIDPFHYYTTLIKFGIGRATYDASQEIRNGKITREEGVNLVKKYDTEFPSRYFKNFLEYIDISESKFEQVIDSYRSPHIWVRDHGQWQLRRRVSDPISPND